MNEREVINTALENLEKKTGVIGIFRDYDDKTVDGKVELAFRNNKYKFLVEVKKEVRPQQLAQLTYQQQKLKKRIMLIAENIFPTAKKELRDLEIPYLETNGNVHVKLNNNLIWVELQKPRKIREEKTRAFTPTGLQVIFEIFQNPKLINQTQREIAEKTKVGLGQINNVLNGLKNEGYLIQKNKNQLVLRRREKLFEKWAITYNLRLRPKIKIGNFRFVKAADFQNWNEIELKRGLTYWGREPAGNILTDYLHPQILTIYTLEPQKELIKNYKIVPVENGNIEVLKKFWKTEWNNHLTAPVELIYADLINTNDKRNQETALKIYEKQIKNKLIGSEV
jgi:hypothetical protein